MHTHTKYKILMTPKSGAPVWVHLDENTKKEMLFDSIDEAKKKIHELIYMIENPRVKVFDVVDLGMNRVFTLERP